MRSPQEQKPLVDAVEARMRYARRWWLRHSIPNDILIAVGWLISVAVPFGIGSLLLVPASTRHTLNIYLLVGSATGLLAQLLAVLMRLREKALTQKTTGHQLEAALTGYHAGLLTLDQLFERYERALELDSREPGP